MSTEQSTTEHSEPGSNEVPLSRILDNLADELTVALAICVNVEEIISDRLLTGGTESNFVRVELQNIDRLIQMLTDFRSISDGIAREVHDQTVPGQPLRDCLVMEEMSRRLLSAVPTRRDKPAPNSSDVTFF